MIIYKTQRHGNFHCRIGPEPSNPDIAKWLIEEVKAVDRIVLTPIPSPAIKSMKHE